jgi:phosphorylase kinase alpha/beta subunit
LEGRYGLKRFLRDGHQTVLEDEHRLHYETEELRQFEHIESEWPLFFVYLYLDALFRNDRNGIARYEQKLAALLVEEDGQSLLPELYFVPADRVAAERAWPHSQVRLPNANVPLVWAQSLYLLGQLVRHNLLHSNDIDPLRRCAHKARREPVVQVALLAEDAALQAALAVHGVATETLQELDPIEVHYPETIAGAYEQVGRNRKLKLTGRPLRRIKSLTTSRVYQLAGRRVACLSALFLQREFYLAYDMHFLADRFRSELAYIHRHWTQLGRPTVTVLLTHNLLEEGAADFFELMQELRSGVVDGVPVKLGRLVQLMPTASFERIDLLHNLTLASTVLERAIARAPLLLQTGPHKPLHHERELAIEVEADWAQLQIRLAAARNLYEQVELLATIARRWGVEQLVEVAGQTVAARDLLEEVYAEAGRRRLWAVVRRASALLGKVDADLDYAVSAILICQKNILVGRAYSVDSLITQPLPPQELLNKINTFCRDDIRDSVLTQELLIYLGLLIKAQPALFADLLMVRVSYLIVLLTSALAHERQITQDEAYEQLMHLAPSEIQHRLVQVLAQYQSMQAILAQLESLHAEQAGATLTWSPDQALEALPTPPQGWHAWRQYSGILSRASGDFYSHVWQLFQYSRGLVIGDKFERRNRLESRTVLSDMTPGETAFALRIEHLLNKIPAPEYRQLNLEALTVLASITEQNSMLRIDDYIVLDVLIGHAVRLAYLHRHPDHEATYSEHKAAAWDAFYALPPISTTDYLAHAFLYLLNFGASLE